MKEIRVDLSPKLLKRIEGSEEEVSLESWAKEEKSGKKLNKPFRTPKGPKKFSVYVKNEKGNVVKVNFGDPNMEIKRDDPARRKNFRARHNCENPGPKTKARYWSCKMWSNKSVTNVTKGSEITEEDFLSFLDESEAKRPGPKSGAQTPSKPDEKKKGSSKNKPGSAGEKGGKITFSEKVINSLKEKVKEHNEKHPSKKVTLSQLKKVYRRGAGAFSTSHRPGMTRGGWAMARVNMFLKMVRGGKVKDSYRKADQDIAKASEEQYASLWENIRKKKKRMGKNYKPAKPGDKDRPDKKAWDKAKGADDPNKHYFKTKEEALKDAEKMGLKGFHTHKTEDGDTLYMAGPNHESFMKKHKEMTKAGWHSKNKK